MDKILRGFFIFGSLYFLIEAILFLFNIRLADVNTNWPESAKVYARLINQVLGSFELLISILCLELQSNLKKYPRLIKISGFWALIHAVVLIMLSVSNNFTNIFSGIPSLYVWMPFYNPYLFFEGLILIFYSLSVYFWFKQDEKKV